MKIIREVQPEITVDKVCRFLGSGAAGRLSQRLRTNLDRSIRTARELVRPSVLFTEKAIKKVDGSSLILEEGVALRSGKLSRTMARCDRAAVFIATIGKEIDALIQKLLARQKLAEAYIFDAIGSCAAEDTVERFHRLFDRRSHTRKEHTTLRFSPGYCDWRVEEQRKLFGLLDNSLIGVHLTPSCLMTPRKSVSGVFGIGSAEIIDRRSLNPCSLCGLTHCVARRGKRDNAGDQGGERAQKAFG
jgi:hypothetical protein